MSAKDGHEARIAALEAEVAALKRAVWPHLDRTPPEVPHQPFDYLSRLSVPDHILQDMARAVPTNMVQDVVGDHTRKR